VRLVLLVQLARQVQAAHKEFKAFKVCKVLKAQLVRQVHKAILVQQDHKVQLVQLEQQVQLDQSVQQVQLVQLAQQVQEFKFLELIQLWLLYRQRIQLVILAMHTLLALVICMFGTQQQVLGKMSETFKAQLEQQVQQVLLVRQAQLVQ
jgi:hypothetical protein